MTVVKNNLKSFIYISESGGFIVIKSTLSFISAFVMAIIVLNNTQDWDNGLNYTSKAMSMAHVPENPLKRRAVTKPAMHRIAYAGIVVWEVLTALLCGLGAVLMLLRQPTAGLRLAIWGHVAGLALFMAAFRGVSGQWFLLWRAGQFNGLPDVHRMIGWFLGVLAILLHGKVGSNEM